MKIVVAFILVLLVSDLSAQSSCESAPLISADQLEKIQLSGDINFIRIKKDSVYSSIKITGDFKSLTSFTSTDCKTKKVLSVFNSIGDYNPTSAQVDQGICNCDNCVKRLSILKLSQSTDVLIRIDGGSKLKVVLDSIRIVKEVEWYEKKYKSGDKIQLENIMFIAGVAKFQRSSFQDLDKLFALLKNNSDLNIEIQGHVNGPRMRNKTEFQDLSEKRAKAVFDYLVKKGIKSERLSSKGYGNTAMVYPKATEELEMQMNRRVEILVK